MQQQQQHYAPPFPSHGQGSIHVQYPSAPSDASFVSSYPASSLPVIPEAEREESEESYWRRAREGGRVHLGGRKMMPQQQEDHGYLTSTHMINKQEVNINQQQQSLAQEAATRQREIEEGMQALRGRIQAIDDKIKRASRERATAATRLQAKLEGKVKGLRTEWDGRIEEHFDWIAKEALPPLTSRLLEVEDSTRHFAHSVLPPAIEATLLLEGGREAGREGGREGGVEAMRRAWETEKNKVMKREQRIEQRLAEHVEKTASEFERETGTRLAALRALEADIRAPQLELVDGEEGFQQQVKTTLRELYDGVAIEAQAREEEDCLVLDSMLESQKALQRIILENYGGGRGAVGGGGVGVGGGSFFLRLESCGEGRSHEEDEEGVEEWER
ncbi:hypothetical protein VYU27_006369 [Nannochloropsis oceanica]